jgi:hypothetical protein
MFPSDGRNHHQAIKVEKNLDNYMSQLEIIYGKEIDCIQHRGGTTNKEDAVIHFRDKTKKRVSVKNKESGVKTGSFDYINTSSFDKKIISNSIESYNMNKGSRDIKGYDNLKESIFKDINNMNSETVTLFILNNIVKKYKEIDLLIIDGIKKVVHLVVPKFFNYINDGGKLNLLIGNKPKMSVKIVDENFEDQFNLRLRLHLNNGKSKFLGLSKGNSYLVLKVQQDKVYSLI